MIKDRQCAVCHKWETQDLSGGGVRFVVIGPLCGSCHTSHENQAAELTRLKLEKAELQAEDIYCKEMLSMRDYRVEDQAKTIERLESALEESNQSKTQAPDNP